VEFLSKEAISKIREAEERALRIIEDAEAEARERISRAEREGEELAALKIRAVSEDIKVRLAKVNDGAAALVESGRAEARTDIADFAADSRANMREAVKIITWGIADLCR